MGSYLRGNEFPPGKGGRLRAVSWPARPRHRSRAGRSGPRRVGRFAAGPVFGRSSGTQRIGRRFGSVLRPGGGSAGVVRPAAAPKSRFVGFPAFVRSVARSLQRWRPPARPSGSGDRLDGAATGRPVGRGRPSGRGTKPEFPNPGTDRSGRDFPRGFAARGGPRKDPADRRSPGRCRDGAAGRQGSSVPSWHQIPGWDPGIDRSGGGLPDASRPGRGPHDPADRRWFGGVAAGRRIGRGRPSGCGTKPTRTASRR